MNAKAMAELLRDWGSNNYELQPLEMPDAKRDMQSAADLLEQQAAELEALQADNAKFKTVMIAAAEEIHAHWDAHCDADGYGPANLQRRLEEGIPSEYGYTAGAFAALRAERDALAQFALAMLESWPLGDVGGDELQDEAIKHGLLVPDQRTAPCSEEGCNCADYYSADEWASGITCYRRAPWLLAARAGGGNG